MSRIFRLEAVERYLYCPLLYFWTDLRGTAVLDIPMRTTTALPKLALLQALSARQDPACQAYPLVQLVGGVWDSWLEQKGVGEDVKPALEGFHQVRYGEILKLFLDGDIRKRDRSKYIEPRASYRYKDMYRTRGLDALSDRIDAAVVDRLGVEVSSIEKLGLGDYSIANAYSDSLVMAGRFSPLPPEEVWGVDEVVSIDLSERFVIEATVDLIAWGPKGARLYVLDGTPMFFFERPWVSRKLILIAAPLMRARPPGDPFPPIKAVIYRHLLSGEEVVRRAVRPSRLVQALLMFERGVSAGIYTPQFLSGDLSRCLACPARSLCLDREDTLEHFYPGLSDVVDKVRQAAARLSGADQDLVRALVGMAQDLTLADITAVEKK
jgi:hypothetical protein